MENIEKLFETSEGGLMKVGDKSQIGFDAGSNLGVTIMRSNSNNIYFQFDQENEIELLAFWLNKNFKLKMCPDFEKLQGFEELKKKSSDYKAIIEDNADRMHELGNIIKRCVSTFKSIMDVEELRGNSILSFEAKKQINAIIDEASKIYD